MLQITKERLCTGCSACFNACPFSAINMSTSKEGFLYPIVSQDKCANCGHCVKICPVNKKNQISGIEKTFYAAINCDTTVRLNSSSGGIFTALATSVLEKGGVVFGAGFDENFTVCHQSAENLKELEGLKTSKYVQSRVGESFKLAKEFLEKGQPVLFTGTPCQIAGLRAYLNKDYLNLFTIDLICHGAPSPIVWQNYLIKLENKFKSKVVYVNFRDKVKSWENYNVTIKFKSGKTYSRPHSINRFMNLFLQNRILRKSCHNCSFKGENHTADITLGDFWGKYFKTHSPEMNDKKGCSLIIANTSKGHDLLLNLKDVKLAKTDGKKALKSNTSYYKSAFKNPLRKISLK